MDKHFVRFFPVSLVILGSAFLILYLYGIRCGNPYLPYAIVTLSVVLLSSGLFLSHRMAKSEEGSPLFLLALYVLTLTLLVIRSVRFSPLSGADNLFEFRAAQETLSSGYWPIQTQEVNASVVSLHVSVFPAIFSMITGIDLIFIFKYAVYAVESIIPLLLFLVNKEVFGNAKIAGIAAILYCENVVFFYQFTLLNRLLIATVFLLLVLFLIFKRDTINVAKSSLLSVILLFSLVAAHYSTAYFSTILFLSLVVCLKVYPFFPKRLTGAFEPKVSEIMIISKYINSKHVLFYLILLLSWLFFLGSWLFSQHAFAAKIVALSMTGLHPEAHHWSTSYILDSPMGPIYTIWSDFIVVLFIFGLLSLWSRKDKNTNTVLWAFGSFTFASLSALWYLIPNISNFASLTRVYGIGSILFSSFVAYILLKGDKKAKGILLIFLTTNLSMNLMLFSQGQDMAVLLYFPSCSVQPEKKVKEVYSTEQGFLAGLWMKRSLSPAEVISGDERAPWEAGCNYGDYFVRVTYPDFAPGSNYLLLHHFYCRYGLWAIRRMESGRVAVFINQSMAQLQANTVYHSDYFVLLQRLSQS